MNKSFQLCWVATVKAASVNVKTDGLLRKEDLAPDFPKASGFRPAGSLAGKCLSAASIW